MKSIPQLDTTARARFWDNVDRSNGCWNWTGYILDSGYGQFKHTYVNYRAHRVAFVLGYGRQPSGIVMHTCDNRKCCNPKHLRDATNADNSADMVAKGRSAKPTGETHPMAKLNEEQVREILRADGPYPLIAKKYGVSSSLVCGIKRGRFWRHLT